MSEFGEFKFVPENSSRMVRNRLAEFERGPSHRVKKFIQEYGAELEESDEVLEVGSGSGRNLIPFAERKMLVHGIEYDKGTVPVSRELLERAGVQADIQRGSFASLPFANEVFKVVLSHSSIQNAKTIEEAQQAFQEIARVLRPDGLYLFAENATPRLIDEHREQRVAYFTPEELR